MQLNTLVEDSVSKYIRSVVGEQIEEATKNANIVKELVLLRFDNTVHIIFRYFKYLNMVLYMHL